MKKIEIKCDAKNYIELSKFKELQGNLKDLTETNYNKLKESILKYGFISPFFAWYDGKVYWIIDAHQRYRVLTNLEKDGYDIPKLPTVLIEAKDKRTAKELLLAINSKYGKMTAEGLYEFINEVNFEIDFDNIKGILDFPDLDLYSFDLGFNKDIEVNEDNYEIPNEIETNIKTGDLIVFSKNGKELHRLLCGDSTKIEDVEKLMNGEKADIGFTSPPYNLKDNSKLSSHQANGKKYINYSDDLDDKDYIELLNKSTSNSIEYCFFSFVNIQSLSNNKIALIDYLYNQKGFYADTIIWNKLNSQPAMAENVLNSQFEYIHIFSKKANRAIGTKKFRGTLANIIDIKKQNKNEVQQHNATFPIELASFIISNFSNNSVIDLFLGSGTTMVAAHQLNRRCYGIEIDNKYCQVIIDRMLKLDSELTVNFSQC